MSTLEIFTSLASMLPSSGEPQAPTPSSSFTPDPPWYPERSQLNAIKQLIHSHFQTQQLFPCPSDVVRPAASGRRRTCGPLDSVGELSCFQKVQRLPPSVNAHSLLCCSHLDARSVVVKKCKVYVFFVFLSPFLFEVISKVLALWQLKDYIEIRRLNKAARGDFSLFSLSGNYHTTQIQLQITTAYLFFSYWMSKYLSYDYKNWWNSWKLAAIVQ